MLNATRLEDRSLLHVSGEEALSFLQALVTNDIAKAQAGNMVYSCLLTAQGRFLHDFFITHDGTDGFYLECERARREDLARRLSVFRLRAKVKIEDEADTFDVYTGTGDGHFQDPRLSALGRRFYLSVSERLADALPVAVWRDYRISLGVPEGSDLHPEIDTLAHANLDHLNAVGWTKGCYVGQEITNMTKTRGTAKKRMVILEGEGLAPGSIFHGESIAGELRAVNSTATQGLAVIRLAALDGPLALDEKFVTARLPGWLSL